MHQEERVAVGAIPVEALEAEVVREKIEQPEQSPAIWPELAVGDQVRILGVLFVIARLNAGTIVLRPKVQGMSARRVLQRLFSPKGKPINARPRRRNMR